MKKNRLVMTGVVLGTMLSPLSVSAQESVSVPITVKNGYPSTVKITSNSEDAMRAIGTSEGCLEKTVYDENPLSFEVTYDEPVDYIYTVTETSVGDDCAQDTSEYQVEVFVKAEDDGNLDPVIVSWRTGAGAKSDGVVFENTKQENGSNSSEKSADTSDDNHILEYFEGMAVALGVLAIVMAIKISRKEKE